MPFSGSYDQHFSLAHGDARAVKVVDKDLTFPDNIHLVFGMLVEFVGALEATQVGTIVVDLAQNGVGERLG
jgi:hypothetical protein